MYRVDPKGNRGVGPWVCFPPPPTNLTMYCVPLYRVDIQVPRKTEISGGCQGWLKLQLDYFPALKSVS